MQNNQPNNILSVLSKLSDADSAQKKQAADSIMSSMSDEDSREFQKILSDRNRISEILNSPAVKQIMQKLNGQHQ